MLLTLKRTFCQKKKNYMNIYEYVWRKSEQLHSLFHDAWHSNTCTSLYRPTQLLVEREAWNGGSNRAHLNICAAFCSRLIWRRPTLTFSNDSDRTVCTDPLKIPLTLLQVVCSDAEILMQLLWSQDDQWDPWRKSFELLFPSQMLKHLQYYGLLWSAHRIWINQLLWTAFLLVYSQTSQSQLTAESALSCLL